MERCVLAYSGGLDTSAIVPWLKGQGYEVHCLMVDVGQRENYEDAKDRALRLGADSAYVVNVVPQMLEAIGPAIGLAAVYEGRYRLGTALARPFIAEAQVALAREIGATAIAHGATGKGNDQVRFEFAYRTLAPDLKVIAPWKEWSFQGRKDLIGYLTGLGHPPEFEEQKKYSLDENLWHLSVEGSALEDPQANLDIPSILSEVGSHFHGTSAATDHEAVEITFENGVPVALGGLPFSLAAVIETLNKKYRNAHWAWDLVLENRFTGIKSRGVYLNPAATLLHEAIDALARAVYTEPAFRRWQQLGVEYADALYRGEYFSVQRESIEASAQPLLKKLSGTIRMATAPHPYAVRIDAEQSLFSREKATFEESDFNHADAGGFIRLQWQRSVAVPVTHEEEHHESTLETGNLTASGV
jgi:argininosuccinate synthase